MMDVIAGLLVLLGAGVFFLMVWGYITLYHRVGRRGRPWMVTVALFSPVILHGALQWFAGR
jgi:hypothetical protein